MSRDNGVSDEKLLDLPNYKQSPHYDKRERIAFEYADRITITSEDVDDNFFQQVRAHYTPQQIIELTCTVAFENFLSKFHHALLIESQGFCPVALSPAQRRRSASGDDIRAGRIAGRP